MPFAGRVWLAFGLGRLSLLVSPQEGVLYSFWSPELGKKSGDSRFRQTAEPAAPVEATPADMLCARVCACVPRAAVKRANPLYDLLVLIAELFALSIEPLLRRYHVF